MRERNPGGGCNRDLTAEAFGRVGRLEPDGLQLWEQLIGSRRLTTRSALRLLQVARTIADLNGKETVCADAVAEASCYRCTDPLVANAAG